MPCWDWAHEFGKYPRREDVFISGPKLISLVVVFSYGLKFNYLGSDFICSDYFINDISFFMPK